MSVASNKLWRFEATENAAAAQELANVLGLPLPIARVLVARGHADLDSADLFLHPRLSRIGAPEELPDMTEAAKRIWDAVDARERVVVFGDYDVDGITSTALMVQVLRKLGADVVPFLPHRIEEGYGLSLEALRRCIEDHNPRLIVTVDCGTGSVAAVEEAAKRGVDVIITDHHQLGDALAPARAVVNPKRGENEDLKQLAGVGVAFKLCHGLVKYGRDQRRAIDVDLKPFLEWVALGTIADVVPLVGENRILSAHGLQRLRETANVGLNALFEVAKLQKRAIGAYQVGFQIGPRLNAAGRLGGAEAALELLLCSEIGRARVLAETLDQANRERQDAETEIVAAALGELESRFDPARDFGLVVAGEGWSPGVIGIVASRLVQRFHRPVVVISMLENGVGRGSCRSIEGFDIVAGLKACSEHLSKFGGHAMAAGLELKEGHCDAFAEAFNRAAESVLGGQDLRPILRIDGRISLDEVDRAFFEAQERMRPFGMGNPGPIWAASGVRIVNEPRILKEKHLKLVVASGARQFDAMGWGMAERGIPRGPLDIAFRIKEDHFGGQSRLMLEMQDFRSAEKCD
ncbi:MAG: single-stranded-DNA-specific exonuclease RecJ [Kiritimatiellae bacterium]|nr:single-stranded-DNA-specific exonuclease RecJ [Kiritimatiellia bacterium]MCO5068188.1 single-stranded-DNA-specific exonuclease RecJ [Kiritimatiellia bacterium]